MFVRRLFKQMSGFLYVLREREFVKTDESIYKIGRTKTSIRTRMEGYPKDSELLFVMPCTNTIYAEKFAINKLTALFNKRTDVGSEYFEGDLSAIVAVMVEIATAVNVLGENVATDMDSVSAHSPPAKTEQKTMTEAKKTLPEIPMASIPIKVVGSDKPVRKKMAEALRKFVPDPNKSYPMENYISPISGEYYVRRSGGYAVSCLCYYCGSFCFDENKYTECGSEACVAFFVKGRWLGDQPVICPKLEVILCEDCLERLSLTEKSVNGVINTFGCAFSVTSVNKVYICIEVTKVKEKDVVTDMIFRYVTGVGKYIEHTGEHIGVAQIYPKQSTCLEYHTYHTNCMTL